MSKFFIMFPYIKLYNFLYRFSDADTSEMEGAADTMPSVSESMPLLTMTANGSAILSPNLLQGLKKILYYT